MASMLGRRATTKSPTLSGGNSPHVLRANIAVPLSVRPGAPHGRATAQYTLNPRCAMPFPGAGNPPGSCLGQCRQLARTRIGRCAAGGDGADYPLRIATDALDVARR